MLLVDIKFSSASDSRC